MDLRGFAAQVGATFLGTGAAVIVLRWLSDSFVGHWLAKGLARYTASIETQELRKRVAIERLDRQRSEFIGRLTQRLSGIAWQLAGPVTMDGAPVGAGPELMYLKRYGEIATATYETVKLVSAAAYLFEKDERLLSHSFAWISRTHADADAFRDAITELVAGDSYWTLAIGERNLRLRTIQAQKLNTDSSVQFQELLSRCREFTTADAEPAE